MRRLAVLAGLLVLLAVLVPRLGPARWRQAIESAARTPDSVDLTLDGMDWHALSSWDFRDGRFSGSWSWGEWTTAGGVLQGREDKGDFAVSFCPVEHGGDFLLETRVRILPDPAGRVTEAHLLTRDGRELHCESGAVLFGGRNQVSVRHMVDGRDHVLRVLKTPLPLSVDTWHTLAFAVRDGRVFLWLDGARLFASEASYPAGHYREPHFAVRNGRAEFAEFRLLVPPRR